MPKPADQRRFKPVSLFVYAHRDRKDASMTGTLGAQLRRARLLADYTQEDLAQELGITRRAYGEWERTGKIPDKRVDEINRILRSDLPHGNSGPLQLPEEPVGRTAQTSTSQQENLTIVVGLPAEARDLSPTERDEMVSAARAAALRIWREIHSGK